MYMTKNYKKCGKLYDNRSRYYCSKKCAILGLNEL